MGRNCKPRLWVGTDRPRGPLDRVSNRRGRKAASFHPTDEPLSPYGVLLSTSRVCSLVDGPVIGSEISTLGRSLACFRALTRKRPSTDVRSSGFLPTG